MMQHMRIIDVLGPKSFIDTALQELRLKDSDIALFNDVRQTWQPLSVPTV